MTRPTEPTDLAALTALLDGATGGEWETDGAEIRVKDGYDMYGDRLWSGETCALRSTDDANATLIAALRNAAPGLIAEVTEARRQLAVLDELRPAFRGLLDFVRAIVPPEGA